MVLDGTTLYFAEHATVDSQGAAGTDGALYRVGVNDDAPALVARKFGDPERILGRYEGATFIETQSTGGGEIIRLADTGEVTVIDAKNATTSGSVVSMWGHWLVFLSADGFKLMGVDLDGTLQPGVLYERPNSSSWSGIMSPFVMQDVVIFADDIFQEFCSIPLSDPSQGPTCVSHGLSSQSELATSGEQYYESTDLGITSYAVPSTPLQMLYQTNSNRTGFQPGKIAYLDEWLYVDLYDLYDGPDSASRLARVPTKVVRAPQDILPQSVVTRHLNYNTGSGGSLTTHMVFAVSASDVYWAQFKPYQYGNTPQYIFSAPLPSKPCDADLPCTAPLICAGGYCTAP
jgi:hypothetical protein